MNNAPFHFRSMKQSIFRNAVLLALWMIAATAEGQTSDPDQVLLTNIKSTLSLSPWQLQKADSLFEAVAVQLRTIDKEITRIARSGLPREEADLKLAIANQQKKDLREMRDLEMSMMLEAEQRKVYEEQIRPAKPQVLHFGLAHDRANCNVCNK